MRAQERERTAGPRQSSAQAEKWHGPAVLLIRVMCALLMCACGVARAVQAHPADEGRVDVLFRVRDGRLTWTVDWWLGNLAGLQFWTAQLDTNKDLALSPAEKQAFADRAAAWPALSLAGSPAAARLDALEVGDYSQFITLPATPQIHAELSAPLPAAPMFSLQLKRDGKDGLAFVARFPAGGGVLVQNQSLTRDTFAADITVRGTPQSAAPAPAPQRGMLSLILAGVALIVAIAAVMAVLSLLKRYRGRENS